MADGLVIRLGTARDAGAIARMLAALAVELKEDHRFVTTADTVARDGFGPAPHFTCMVAQRAGAPGAELEGLSLFLREYSTIRAQPGVYVQDLWVSQSLRGTGAGRRLLMATAAHARDAWGAGWLALTVHGHNEAAFGFYRRLGFLEAVGDRPMYVDGAAFADMAA